MIVITTNDLKEDDWYPFFENFAIATGIDVEINIVAKEQISLLYAGGEDTIPDFLYARKGVSPFTVDQINEYGFAGALINYADHLDQMPTIT